MTTPDTGVPFGWDRVSGLLAWWGLPAAAEASEMTAHVDRVQMLVAEMNRLFREVSSTQGQVVADTNERLAQALHEAMAARQPSDVMAVQTKLVVGLMESTTAQASAWTKLSQDLHACCSAMVREAGSDATSRPDLTEASAEKAGPKAGDTGKQAAGS